MFTVKAEVRRGGESFQLYQAASVHVRQPQCWQSHVTPPDFVVDLHDDQNNSIRQLEVGNSLEHYSSVYVMNERGKTVQSVYCSPGTNEATATPMASRNVG